MAEIIKYPDPENANPDEWRIMREAMEILSAGLLQISLENLNSGGPPKVKAGSRLDINGPKFLCKGDENVPAASPGEAETVGAGGGLGELFVYAKAEGEAAKFVLGTAVPVWDPVKFGWYKGNFRAVARLFKSKQYATSTEFGPFQWCGKTILENNENALKRINTEQEVPEYGGDPVFDSETDDDVEFAVSQPGAYRYEVQGGSGGAGGKYQNSEMDTSGAGGEKRAGAFIVKSPVSVQASLGMDGNDGTFSYSGGGGAAGGESFLLFKGHGAWHYKGGGSSLNGGSLEQLEGKKIAAAGGAGGGGEGSPVYPETGDPEYGGGGGAAGYGQGKDGGRDQDGKGGSVGMPGKGGLGNGSGQEGSLTGDGGANSYGAGAGKGKKYTSSGHIRISRVW